jgi:tetratricopeptide (TPR) repeat protein
VLKSSFVIALIFSFLTYLLCFSYYCAFRCGDSIKAIKSLNNAIKCCPCSPSNIEGGGNHLPGLSEALVLLSEAYSTLGKDKDAIHSARLAVECAHKRLVTTTTSSTAISSESKQQEKLLRHCRPLLDRLPALLVTYLTLATMLERIGTEAQQLALEWYTRVITTASKMMHERVIDESIVERRDPEENLEMVYNQINEISVSAQEAKFRLQREPSKTSHNNNLLRPESDTGIGAEGTIKGRRREDHLYDDSDIQLNLSERGNEHFSEDNGWNDSGYIGGRQTHTEGNHVINDKGVIHF